jgi:hypothetical protein
VSSRFLLGLGAWLLGAVTATSGSMIAVNTLAHGLLDAQAQAQQLGGKVVSGDLEPKASNTDESPSASPAAAAGSRTPAAKAMHSASPSSNAAARGSGRGPVGDSPSQSPPSGSSQSPAGTLLVSSGGSVTATCESAGAYLLYWSPNQGFEVDNVVRGPAAVASVVFQNTTSGIVMRVSCSGGKPIAQVGHDT